MFSYIKGTLEEILEGQVVVESHGVGYQICTPKGIVDELPPRGEAVKIYTYFSVKEDGVSLYGFSTKEGRRLFGLLLKVNGIGPKGALGILSALSEDELRFAVLAGDAKTIAKAPGVGAKSAQRIILELRDKLNLEEMHGISAAGEAKAAPSEQTASNEAAQALMALGYSSSEALSAVAKVEALEGADVEEILKAALKQMALL